MSKVIKWIIVSILVIGLCLIGYTSYILTHEVIVERQTIGYVVTDAQGTHTGSCISRNIAYRHQNAFTDNQYIDYLISVLK